MVVLDDNGDREPDYWISDMDHRITGHLTWITGLLDIRHGSQDYWTFDLDYRTTGYPTWITGLLDI